jgi:hypothetical protein
MRLTVRLLSVIVAHLLANRESEKAKDPKMDENISFMVIQAT